VMAFGVHSDRVVIIEGPVGYKRTWWFPAGRAEAGAAGNGGRRGGQPGGLWRSRSRRASEAGSLSGSRWGTALRQAGVCAGL
jgi:hypothetical protein